jgi:hypothetical protein
MERVFVGKVFPWWWIEPMWKSEFETVGLPTNTASIFEMAKTSFLKDMVFFINSLVAH